MNKSQTGGDTHENRPEIPDCNEEVRCDQIGCRHGEFDWPSGKGLCPKCAGNGKIPARPVKTWCAMCGRWGDHGSGSCPELVVQNDTTRMDWLCQCTAGQWEALNNLRLSSMRGELRSLVDGMMKQDAWESQP